MTRIELGVKHQEFALEFLACSLPAPFIATLAQQCQKAGITLHNIDLTRQVVDDLHQKASESLPTPLPDKFALIVTGLETSIFMDSNEERPAVFQRINLAREQYKSFNYPFIICLSGAILQKLQKVAPDFWSWRSAEPLQLIPTKTFVKEEINQALSAVEIAGWDDAVHRISLLERLLEAYEETGEPTSSQPDPLVKLEIWSQLGDVYKLTGKYAKARRAYERALKIAERLDQPELRAKLLNKLGIVLRDLEENPQISLNYFQEYLKHAQEKGDPSGQGAALNNLGLIYLDMGDLEAAESLLQQALDINQATGDAAAISNT
ncbi:MAG: tetratricopeptide repeat protein [Desulfobacca sp.]|nr:tetratricopeptide repeat protein [Desulfobacca sp.]